MLLGMSPPTLKERRQGYRQAKTPKPGQRTKLKASPPAQGTGSSATSARRRSHGASTGSPGAPTELGDLARKLGMMGARPAQPAANVKPKRKAKAASSASPGAAGAVRRTPSLQRGKGLVLVSAHSPSPQPGIEVSPPVSETDSQSDGSNTADEREQPESDSKQRSGKLFPGSSSPMAVNTRSTQGRGGRLRVNRVVNEGRELAAAEGAGSLAWTGAVQKTCISVDLPQVDAAHPLEQAWARQTNSRYDALRSLKLDNGIKHAPAVDWAVDSVTQGVWQHLGGTHEHKAREQFCSEMLAPNGQDQGSVSCPPGLVQVPHFSSADTLQEPPLTADEIAGLLAGPCTRMQKLHSSMTRMSYRALYPRTGPALAAEQDARRKDKAMATMQLLWPRSSARRTLLRRRQEHEDCNKPGATTPRSSADAGDSEMNSSSPPAPDLWAPEKRSTIETLKAKKERRLLRARAAGHKAKADAAQQGVTYKRTKEVELQRAAQEEAEWRARQAAKREGKGRQVAVEGQVKSNQGKAEGTDQKDAVAKVSRKYEGASAGESPLAAAARVLLARTAPELRRQSTAGVELCVSCGLAASQLGHVDSATGGWRCQHCGVQSGGTPECTRLFPRRGSTEDLGGSSSTVRMQETAQGQKRRPIVRRRPQSAALQRSARRPTQSQSSSQSSLCTDDLDYPRWGVGTGGSPKTAAELGFESRMRMVEMLGGVGGRTSEDEDDEASSQHAQATALAKTLMHRGASRADAERSAARTIQSTSRSMKMQTEMRPQSASGVPARSHAASAHHTPGFPAVTYESELEAVMLETVGALTAERGRIAEQLAWAKTAGSSSATLLAERMQAAEQAVEAATRVLAQPRSDRSSVAAQKAGGGMIEAAKALRDQVASCRDEQLAKMSPRPSRC